MKRNVIYLVLAVMGGLFLGYLFFYEGGENQGEAPTQTATDSHEHSGEEEGALWTCSMHPQILQPEPGDCPICGMDLIPAETSSSGPASNAISMSDNAAALANIRTTTVGGDMAESGNTISLSGKIQENEEATSVQSSYFDGRIERLHVNFKGQEIRKGQLLATIYAPNLVAAQQELITASALRSSQPALYQAVRNKLKLWKLSDKQINSIEETGEVLENFPVYATVSGTVAEVMAREGDYVQQGQPILKVSDLSNVWASFDAYENQLSLFRKGQQLRLTTRAYPDKVFEATISFVGPVLDAQSRTLTVRAVLPNKEGLLKPGMFVSGKIEVQGERPQQGVTIPSSAVLWTGERSLVYVRTSPGDQTFEMREVTLGAWAGEQVTILEGLEPGEEVVTHGTFTVDAAAQLQGKKSMMNQAGGRSMTGHEAHAGMNQPQLNASAEGTMKDMELPDSFKKGMEQALPAYFRLKDALVTDDVAGAAAAAREAREKITAISREAMGAGVGSALTKSMEFLEAIGQNTSLENQRSHFALLNEQLSPLVMALDNLSIPVYLLQCPMANANKGAVWFSKEKVIRNPYYGEEMLECGSVIDSVGTK